MHKLYFKEAGTPAELEQIHLLNHRVFAEEIAQHPQQNSGLLVDHLHNQNRYFVAVRSHAVIGMISVNEGPDFSLSKRLADPRIIQVFDRPLEVRLLAIDPLDRNRTVLAGLIWQTYSFALSNGFSHVMISAIATRQLMYQKLGFRALGPSVPEGAAAFMPMAMTLKSTSNSNSRRVSLYERRWRRYHEIEGHHGIT